MVHMYLLQFEKFLETYARIPEGMSLTTKAGIAWKADTKAKGQKIIKNEDLDLLTCYSKSISDHPTANKYLFHDLAKKEEDMEFVYRGERCRAVIDLYFTEAGRTICIDLKTATNVVPNKFKWSVMDFGYHIQGYFYVLALKQKYGLDAEFKIVALESKPRYGVSGVNIFNFDIGGDFMRWGKTAVDRGIEVIQRLRDGEDPATMLGKNYYENEIEAKMND